MKWDIQVTHVTEKHGEITAHAGTLVLVLKIDNETAFVNHECKFNLERFLRYGYTPIGFGYCVDRVDSLWRVMWREFGEDVDTKKEVKRSD